MQVRNLKHNKHGTIDCELEIKQGLWIPFTASPDDSTDYGRMIYQDAIDGKLGDIKPIEQIKT